MPRSRTNNVSASPAAAAETVIAAITGMTIQHDSVVDLEASCDVTIGTAGTGATLKLVRGAAVGGVTVVTFGPFTVAAGNRVNLTVNATDLQSLESSGLGYVLTLTVVAATGVSTVNAVYVGAVY